MKETKAEYEIRFYNSHKYAVEHGTSFTEERRRKMERKR